MNGQCTVLCKEHISKIKDELEEMGVIQWISIRIGLSAGKSG